MSHTTCSMPHGTWYMLSDSLHAAFYTSHFTLHTSPFTRHWGCCCFFNKQKPRNSTFFDRLRLARLDLEAGLQRCPRRLRKSRLKITWPVMDATLCVMINFQVLTLLKRRQMHIERLYCTIIVINEHAYQISNIRVLHASTFQIEHHNVYI